MSTPSTPTCYTTKKLLADEQVAARRKHTHKLQRECRVQHTRGAAVESCNQASDRTDGWRCGARCNGASVSVAQVAELRGANDRLRAEVSGANKRTKVLAPDAVYNANHGVRIL